MAHHSSTRYLRPDQRTTESTWRARAIVTSSTDRPRNYSPARRCSARAKSRNVRRARQISRLTSTASSAPVDAPAGRSRPDCGLKSLSRLRTDTVYIIQPPWRCLPQSMWDAAPDDQEVQTVDEMVRRERDRDARLTGQIAQQAHDVFLEGHFPPFLRPSPNADQRKRRDFWPTARDGRDWTR